MTERDECKAQGTKHDADTISHLHVLETGNQRGPHHRAQSLDGIEHARPVAGSLISLGLRVVSVPDCLGDGTYHIGPHIEQGSPTEELYQTDAPEILRSTLEQSKPVSLVFLLGWCGVIFIILVGCPLLHLQRSVDDTNDEDSCTNIERPDDRIGHYTLGSHILNAYPCEEEGKHESHHTTGIAKKRLDAVCLTFLFLIDHVAHHHLERLHGHVQ